MNTRRLVVTPLLFLVALAATLFGPTAQSAAASPGPETRVRAFDTPATVTVGSESIKLPAIVEHLRLPPAQIASATGVATNTVRLGSVAGDAAAARAHLATIPDALAYGPNRAMLGSIDDAIASGRPLTGAERSFLDHELLEAGYVGSGMSQEAAHALTLQTVPAASNYSPAVIQQFPDHFSDYYFNYWGISRGG